MGEGKISENVYVVGSVISDRTTRNYPSSPTGRMAKNPANTMFIQDADAGLWIEFGNEADNTYDLNDRVTIHMYGQIIARDAYTNGLKIDRLVVGRAVVRAGSGGRADRPGRRFAPFAVREPAGDAPQRGVRCPTVRWSTSTSRLPGRGTGRGIPGFGRLQRPDDRVRPTMCATHTAIRRVSYTTWSFTERALSMMPEGAGDITGIVNKRCKCDVYDGRDESRRKVESWCIRIRRESDITNFDADPATRLRRRSCRSGRGPTTEGAADRHGLRRQGQLKHSVGVDVLPRPRQYAADVPGLAGLMPARRQPGTSRPAVGSRPTATRRVYSTSP